jgi:hypothetical protein
MAANEFTLFPQLPYDIRYCIWRFTLPYRDVKVVRDTSDGPFYTTLPMEAPVVLHVCRESREVACAHGRFIKVHRDTYTANVWVDRSIRMVYLPTGISSLQALQRIGCRASAVVYLRPSVADAKLLYRFLAIQRDDTTLSTIKTLYFALSRIVYSGETPDPSDTRIYPPYQGSDVCVLALDDSRVLPLLEAAFSKEKDDNPSGLIYHQTPTCFLNRLRAYWDTHPRAKEIQADHDAIAREEANPSDPALIPRLRPAVVFGKTKRAVLYGRNMREVMHDKACGLVFKASDVAQIPKGGVGSAMRYSLHFMSRRAYDCESKCRTAPVWSGTWM